MRAGEGTVLLPAIRTTAWEQGLGCRVVLTRDWGCDDVEGNTVTDVRVAEVVKADGTVVPEEKRRLVGFTIDNVCYALAFVSIEPYFVLTRSRLVFDPLPSLLADTMEKCCP